MTPKFLCEVFLPPVGFLSLGCVPIWGGLLFSGHGGLGWFILPLCFPYIVIRLMVFLYGLPAERRRKAFPIALIGVLAYILISYPIARRTENCVFSGTALPIQPGTMFKLATFPVGYLLASYPSANSHNTQPTHP